MASSTLGMIMSIFILFIFLLFLINKKFCMNTYKTREKQTPFECGFMSKSSPRLPFSLQFFIIGLIFLIFDVEISLILPFIYTSNLIDIYNNILIMSYFMMILILGTMLEWLDSTFDWWNK